VKRSVKVTLDKTTYKATFKAACANKYLQYVKAVPYHCKRHNTGANCYLSYSIIVFSVTKKLISGKANKRARPPTEEKPQAEQVGDLVNGLGFPPEFLSVVRVLFTARSQKSAND